MDWDGTPVGIECTDEVLEKIDEWMSSGIASFDDDKIMVVKCAAQNYIFTTQQAADLISKLTWDDGQAEACALFKNRLLNPEDGGPMLDLIDKDKLKEEVRKMLADCKKAEVRELNYLPCRENEGVRDDGDVEAFLAAIEDGGLESNRDKVVDNEIRDRPSPPFTGEQFSKVLDKFTFSDEAAKICDKMARARMFYHMEATEMAELLGKYLQSKDKLKMLRSLKPLIRDPQNKALLCAHFEFPSDKREAEIILRDVFVECRYFHAQPGGSANVNVNMNTQMNVNINHQVNVHHVHHDVNLQHVEVHHVHHDVDLEAARAQHEARVAEAQAAHEAAREQHSASMEGGGLQSGEMSMQGGGFSMQGGGFSMG